MPTAQMSPAAMRRALQFAGEPMHAHDSLAAVGFACDASEVDALAPSIQEQLRRVMVEGGEVCMHTHIATATFRPVHRSTDKIAAMGSLLSEQPLKSCMHAIRSADGLESAWARGVVWVMRLARESGGDR